ncbi:nucleoside triphosphate pyrophosphohydrolase [Bacillus kexueae]|uniref:nucleoside triphosphate pyrophosphohydrolase n=1 Tax=Aeribacillus kexueae TaxID=2078952 RepID=UPI001FAEAD31|nr:nucleoside triphosphate pyrophosphohydrolase [Bacillus kexueae]
MKIIVIGLGAGDLEQLPFGIYQLLTDHQLPLFLRTKHHPVVEQLSTKLQNAQSFDHVYEMHEQFDDVYEDIVSQLVKLAKDNGEIVYAVPGHPLVAEKTVQLLLKRHHNGEVEVEIKGGQSFIDDMLTAVQIDPIEGFQFVDAIGMQREELSYRQHMFICQVYDHMVASEVKLTLMDDLPYDYPVFIVTAAGSKDEVVKEVPLYELDRHVQINNLTSVYVPPVKEEELLYHQFSSLRSVIAELRGPNGCPWDRKQTHHSLKRYLIEECYELLEAIENEDIDHMIEELGDVLLQIMLHAQIGEDDGLFTIDEVVRSVTSKMIRRHPHVFGEVSVDDAEEVVSNWEEIKKVEKGNQQEESILDSIASSLPALTKAYKLQKKAAKVGFDWTNVNDAWKKVHEEISEFETEIREGLQDKRKVEKEFGDILFAFINIARFYDIEPETALSTTNHKFLTRFQYIEAKARETGTPLTEMSLEEMDRLWEEAKRLEEE